MKNYQKVLLILVLLVVILMIVPQKEPVQPISQQEGIRLQPPIGSQEESQLLKNALKWAIEHCDLVDGVYTNCR